jgi:hypothetical protein
MAQVFDRRTVLAKAKSREFSSHLMLILLQLRLGPAIQNFRALPTGESFEVLIALRRCVLPEATRAALKTRRRRMKNPVLRNIMRLSSSIAVVVGMGALPAAASGPDPGSPYVQSISYGGTGCPQGSVGSSFAADRLSFTLIFDQFVAWTGTGVPIEESSKNCQLNVNVHVPEGSGAACMSFDYRGYVQAPAGNGGTQQAIYYFGGTQIDGGATSFQGPVAKDYLESDYVLLPYSGGAGVEPLAVNSQVRVNVAFDQAQITTDSIDGFIGACTLQECMNGGWERYGFKNQGQCIRSVNTGKASR